MFGWLVGRLRCFKGKHQRSERLVQRTGCGETYVSRCKYCGTPMKRRNKRDWIAISHSEFKESLALPDPTAGVLSN